MKVSLPGIEWSKSSRTVLLVLSTTCHFCTESAPFYQKLQQQKPGNVQIVAVLPQAVEDGRQYLNKLGVSVSELVQAPLASLNVKAEDFGWVTRKLMDVADASAGGRVVSVLEGGYDLQGLKESVAAHVTALMGA